MIVTTGFGYFKKDGKNIIKYELPLGEHPDPIGFDVVEVADKAALDAITIDKAARETYEASLQ